MKTNKTTLDKFNLTLGKYLGIRFSIAHKLRPSARFVKQYFNKPIKVLEIGVYKGENAFNMLNHLCIQEAWLMDGWEEAFDFNIKHLNKCYIQTVKRLKKFENKINLIKGYSHLKVDEIPDNYFDYIYIDGDHTYEASKRDMQLYWRKLKKGGIMGGHDISKNNKRNCRVSKAFCELVVEKDLEPYIYGCDWWIIKEK